QPFGAVTERRGKGDPEGTLVGGPERSVFRVCYTNEDSDVNKCLCNAFFNEEISDWDKRLLVLDSIYNQTDTVIFKIKTGKTDSGKIQIASITNYTAVLEKMDNLRHKWNVLARLEKDNNTVGVFLTTVDDWVCSTEECNNGSFTLSSDVTDIWWFSGYVPTDKTYKPLNINMEAKVTASGLSSINSEWSIDATCAVLNKIGNDTIVIKGAPGVGAYQTVTVSCKKGHITKDISINIRRPWFVQNISDKLELVKMLNHNNWTTVYAYRRIKEFIVIDNHGKKIKIDQLPINESFAGFNDIWGPANNDTTDWTLNPPVATYLNKKSDYKFEDTFGFKPWIKKGYRIVFYGGPFRDEPTTVYPGHTDDWIPVFNNFQYYRCGTTAIGKGALIGEFLLDWYRGYMEQTLIP
ncbi:MAG: hypothetical protein ACOCPM_07300, partial [Bacteroidales bacterium]